MSTHITSTVKHPPSGRFVAIAEAILGKKYELSIVFVGSRRATTLNQQTRGKSYTPNVLSFPLTPQAGEIFICPEAANKEAAGFSLSHRGYLEYLCIHGCLHLLGHEHSDEMDAKENAYLKKFSIA